MSLWLANQSQFQFRNLAFQLVGQIHWGNFQLLDHVTILKIPYKNSNANIHYAPLMMAQKESPRNHPWVIPKKVACLVWDPDSRLIVNDGWFLLLLLLLGRAEILLIERRKRWGIHGWFLLLYLPCPALPCSRKHSLSGNSNHFVYFSRNHPGSTHGWFLGDSFCDIINGS